MSLDYIVHNRMIAWHSMVCKVWLVTLYAPFNDAGYTPTTTNTQ